MGRLSAWGRRNRLALVAVAVLVPLTGGAVAWNEWHGYWVERHWQVVDVEPGATVELRGATIGPAELAAAPAGLVDAPSGAQALVVAAEVVPGAEPLGCLNPRLVEPATGREWEAVPLADGSDVRSCFEATEPVSLLAGFAVPDGAGPFALDVELTIDGPELPRLHLDGP